MLACEKLSVAANLSNFHSTSLISNLLRSEISQLPTASWQKLAYLYNSCGESNTVAIQHLGVSPQLQLLKILRVAVTSTVGIRVERMTVLQQPDLAPSDFHLFGPLKQHLGDKHFADDDDVQHEVLLWMRQQPEEFYAAGVGALIKRWDKCINIGGDYVEK
ncbi:hypothetical protein AVEN_52048-1 [Araneus ventricosus]|uniref:Uncharacterized protein n=1 Tax=Araneus ventricosus TaxID=182803 RepID=A0A4Y2CFZ4_ARAVE|nr:hypothetical protein AVEN_52048-1 [Araneus ventricosus]